MKKSRKVLSLNKLVISKLNDPVSIKGGTGTIIVADGPNTHSKNPLDCPTGTLTCETVYMSCKSCFPCTTNIQTENNC